MTDHHGSGSLWRPSRRAVLGGGLALIASSAVPAIAPTPPRFAGRVKGWSRTPFGMVLHLAAADVGLSFAAGVVSVTKTTVGALPKHRGLFEPMSALTEPVKVEEGHAQIQIRSIAGVVSVDKATGALSFSDANGVRLHEIDVPAATSGALRGLESLRGQLWQIRAEDALYGLGQFSEPFFNYRDKRVYLAHANYDVCNPMLVSSGGWGLFWDNQTAGYFSSAGDQIAFCTTNPQFVRYHVMLGTSMDAVVAGFRRLTGAAPLLGQWAFGYWQSKERYVSQEDVIGVVDEYRARHIPFDNIVQDWAYWGSQELFSGMVWDPVHYPNPAAMAAHVHAAHSHIIVSIWPAFGPKSPIYAAMQAEGLLFPSPHWSGGRVYDATSPRARDIYWRYVKAALLDNGIDGFWTDGIEPEFMATGNRYGTMEAFAANGMSAAGPIKDNLLTFSYYQSLGLYEHMVKDAPAKRPFMLSRKAYAGQQAFATTTWSGDIYASWGTLSNQVKAGLNFCLSGIPYWTDDIGGFLVTHRFPDGLSDPAYTELYVRWFQFGSFMPIFRAHGTQIPREIWRFGAPGEPVYDALLAALKLRYELMPYIYSVGAAVTLKHDSVMRPLVMDFPRDRIAQGVSNQFMFGHDLMVTVIDRPYFQAPANIQEFVANTAITGRRGALAATVEFFEDTTFGLLQSRHLTDELKMTWTGDLPLALKGKPYSVRWSGCLTPPESGEYEFVIMGKGSMQVKFAGKTVMNHDDAAPNARNGETNGGVVFKSHDGDWRERFVIELTAGEAIDFEFGQTQPLPDVVSTWVEWITPSQRQKMQPPSRKITKVYAPEGLWYDWHTHEPVRGPGFIDREVRLAEHPVWARAGAIIPTSPGIEYAQQPLEAVHVRVFTGADGFFELYQDAGDGHEWMRGEYALIPMRWDDKARTFRIGARQGQYQPAVGERTFIVELIGMERAAASRTITHTGEEIILSWI